jgi:[acyl-carrier-protein] S-malonyltransferase
MMEQDKIAYVFPGQGSQEVGMGLDIYVHYAIARDVFDQVDKTLGFPLSRLCFEGPEDELTQTVNVQPAIMTVSIAYLKVVQEESGYKFPAPAFAAGHSLGEYTALVATGVLSLADGVRLVRERGRLMHEAGRRKHGGMMALLGMDQGTIEEICLYTGCEISNINAPGQIVIAGTEENLAKARRLAQVKGAKRIIPLKVSGAFHSTLMEPAAQGLKDVIAKFNFSRPTVPIVSNVTAEPVTEVEAIKEGLIRQIRHCVQWQQSIENIIAKGATTFFEIGPGEVLTGLIRRISPGVQTFNVGNLQSVREVANIWKGL